MEIVAIDKLWARNYVFSDEALTCRCCGQTALMCDAYDTWACAVAYRKVGGYYCPACAALEQD